MLGIMAGMNKTDIFALSLSWCRGLFPWSRLFVGPLKFRSCSSTS